MFEVLQGDSLEVLQKLEANSAQCCVTSPPYWGLRDYDHEGQIGQEETLEEFVANLVKIFAEVRRVLTDTGTLWLNMGDTYKDKQLLGVPWLTSFALQEAGWLRRSEIIWYKPNAVPSPVDDRPTTAHEHIFLMTKGKDYYYNADAIRETPKTEARLQPGGNPNTPTNSAAHGMNARRGSINPKGVNKRSVWAIPTAGLEDAHFAVFPEELVENCIRAGSKEGDTILDPFCGSGTTGVVAVKELRNFVGVELNPEYLKLAKDRIERAAAQNRLFA